MQRTKLIIEVDGSIHLLEAVVKNDLIRQTKLEEAGFKVIRFKNDEVLKETNSFVLVCRPGKYKFFVFASDLMASPEPINFTILDPSIAVGINEEKKDPDLFSIYPNPANDYITISSTVKDLKSVTLLNMYSQIIEQKDIEEASTTLPISNYPSGIYFVRVVTLTERISIKKKVIQ